MPFVLSPRAWFLSSQERGNPHAELYAGVAGGAAWAPGNRVTPLVDGAAYFTRLCAELRTAGPADWVLFADWRGDPRTLAQALQAMNAQVVLDMRVRRGGSHHQNPP